MRWLLVEGGGECECVAKENVENSKVTGKSEAHCRPHLKDELARLLLAVFGGGGVEFSASAKSRLTAGFHSFFRDWVPVHGTRRR